MLVEAVLAYQIKIQPMFAQSMRIHGKIYDTPRSIQSWRSLLRGDGSRSDRTSTSLKPVPAATKWISFNANLDMGTSKGAMYLGLIPVGS